MLEIKNWQTETSKDEDRDLNGLSVISTGLVFYCLSNHVHSMCVLRAALRVRPTCFRFITQAVEAVRSLGLIMPSPRRSMTWLHTPLQS